MTSQELTDHSLERLLAAQTPWGRVRLNAGANRKSLKWLRVVNTPFFVKRAFDIIVSAIALLLLLPVFLGIALLVMLDGGPVFFSQTRIGLNGRGFRMFKFRSMRVDAEARLNELLARNEKASGRTFKMKDDPRITPIGKLLRRSSLDELPQFWNVLRGDMSLVGPRPAVPREVALYSQADRDRLKVKPGLTCLWQVGERRGGFLEIGDRNTIDFHEQFKLDVRYIENQGVGWRPFVKDLCLLAKTAPVILFGE